MEQRILSVLRNVLDDQSIDTTCSQQTCSKWDSMNHLNLVVELEMEFCISLEPEEIGILVSYKAIKEIIYAKLHIDV